MDVKFIRMQFTDIFGQLKNAAIIASRIEKALDNQIMIDGSSIEGFVHINESDQYLWPDLDSFVIFPWRPSTARRPGSSATYTTSAALPFVGDPRSVLEKAKAMGYDTFNMGLEAEFLLFQTFDSKGELLITIMSSLAPEESRSLSENITWGQRKRFSDGKVNLPYKVLGYRKGPDGFPEAVEDESKSVCRIYTLFMEGKTSYAIAQALTADGIPTPSGKSKWGASVMESILTNEKYKGAALLQKCYMIDFHNKKRKANEGKVQQYYIEKSRQPIIQPHEFDVVQAEFARRKGMGLHYSGGGVFSSRLVCDDCGNYYGPKVWY